MSSIYDWSLIAAQNANSDDIINWAHGQAPSTVNGSARSMMKRIAEYIRDLSGTAQVTGDGNIITVNLTSKINKYRDGLRFYFRANFTNSKTIQVRVGSLALLPVFQSNPRGLAKTEAGSCQKDCLYELIYSSHLGDADGAWFLVNPTRTAKKLVSIPTGVILHYADVLYNKEDWLMCDGTNVSKAKYAKLYEIVGDKWGTSSKGPDYFALPDLRGVFLRGADNGKGIDPQRKFASFQYSANKSHTHEALCKVAGEHSHMIAQPREGDLHVPNLAPQYSTSDVEYENLDPSPIKASGSHKHDITIEKEGETEARPCNYSVLYLIKT